MQKDFFSAFYYTRNESSEAMISCMKILDICNVLSGRQASSPHHQIGFGFVSDGETSVATPLERM